MCVDRLQNKQKISLWNQFSFTSTCVVYLPVSPDLRRHPGVTGTSTTSRSDGSVSSGSTSVCTYRGHGFKCFLLLILQIVNEASYADLPSHKKPTSPQMKSLQLWQKVGLVRVTFFRQWPGVKLWSLGWRPGHGCAFFFRVRGLAVRQSAVSGSAGVLRQSAIASFPTTSKFAENAGYEGTHFRRRKAWISQKYPTISGEISHAVRYSRSAGREGDVLGLCPGVISTSEATDVQICQPGHDTVIQTRSVFTQVWHR